MTREEFIEVLDNEGYSYKIEGGKVIVTHKEGVDLYSQTSLPPDVVFKNRGDVDLYVLTSLPPGVEFRNRGHVYSNALTSISPGVVFKNRGGVWLNSLTSLPPGVEFKNGGKGIYLGLLIGGWFRDWKGNIKGIDSKRLLNSMISKGVFER
jgi:hypothetical protein